MNYYEHHLGDYMRDTAHLSLVEDGVYRRLIDAYYAREKPLPNDLAECCKLARVSARGEKQAVSYVLKEFFTLEDDGWHQKRCDEVIAKFRDKSQKARASAQASVESRRRSGAEIRSERMAAARAKGKHTDSEWDALREFCGHKCCKCGAGGHQDRDHILPVYQGGSDGIDNIQPLCARCNASKGPESIDYRPNGWREYVERTLSERSANAQRTLSERCAPNLQSPVTSNQEDSRRGEAPSLDQALYADARRIFGSSIGGQISKAIKAHGKPWLVGVIDACRTKDPEQARAYLAAAMTGAKKPDEALLRKVIP